MNFTIAPIVEGYGDVPAIRVLIQRVAPEWTIASPVRQAKGKLMRRDGLCHAVNIASANITGHGAVIVLFDADDDCAKVKGPELQKWLHEDFPHVVCRVVLAVREFEAWIVGGDAKYGISDPDNARSLEDRIREEHGSYKKTVDQPRHISRSDLERLKENSRSFRKFLKTVEEIQALAAETQ